MGWIAAIICVGMPTFFIWEHSERLPRDKGTRLRRWFWRWAIKGVAVPAAIWAVFNLGVFDSVPSLIMQIAQAPPGAAHTAAVAHGLGLGFFAIASYWAALTSGWLLLSLYRQAELRDDLKVLLASWSFLLGPVALLLGFSLGWYYAGLAGFIWLLPLCQVTTSFMPDPVKKPIYSRAVASMNFDKYEDAEMAVIQELEKCEDDFEGWMLLAELYAVHFHDLPEAERTLLETCDSPQITDSQRSVALHKLADWRLKLADDPEGARRHLETLIRTTGNSHLAHMATLRLRQLPASREEYFVQRTRKFRLPALRKDLEEAATAADALAGAAAAGAESARDQAVFRARRLSEQLQKNPDSASERDELARLLAEKLGKVDAGLDQLELLLTLPGQDEQQQAEWLALMAAWQLKYKRDEPAGRRVLERLVRQFPQSAQAFAAQRRLNLLDLEAKMRLVRPMAPAPEPKISIQAS